MAQCGYKPWMLTIAEKSVRSRTWQSILFESKQVNEERIHNLSTALSTDFGDIKKEFLKHLSVLQYNEVFF